MHRTPTEVVAAVRVLIDRMNQEKRDHQISIAKSEGAILRSLKLLAATLHAAEPVYPEKGS